MDEDQIEARKLCICPACGQIFFFDCSLCPLDNCRLAVKEPQQIVGMLFDQTYRITGLLGAGEMALVYKAIDKNLGIELAVKLLHLEMLSNKESLARFQREVEVLASLSHPNIIAFRQLKVTSVGQPYLLMDYLKGNPLDEMIEETGGLSPQDAVRFCLHVCDALAHAHERGIVHRDLKPGNIIILKEGVDQPRAILLDFGIAKILEPMQAKQSQRLTRTGQVFGTPFYMSPEQWRSEPIDPRSDIYSLGVVLYEMIAASRPFDVETLASVIFADQESRAPALSELRPDLIVSVELQATIAKAMKLEKQFRYQTIAEFKSDLMKTGEYRAATTGKTQQVSFAHFLKRNRRKILSFALLFVLLLAGLFLADGFSAKSGQVQTAAAAGIAGLALRPADPLLVRLRLHLADLFFDSGKFKEALEEYEKLDGAMQLGMKVKDVALVRTRVVEAASKSGVDKERISNLAYAAALANIELAAAELKSGKVDKCMSAWLQSLQYKKLGKWQAERKNARMSALLERETKLASDLYDLNKNEQALQVYESVLENGKVCYGIDSGQIVRVLFMMGNAAIHLQQSPRAEEYYQQALNIALKIPEKVLKANVVEILFGLGNSQRCQGKYAESADTYKQSLERSRTLLGQTTLPLAEKLYDQALKLKGAKAKTANQAALR